jgi:hypothetical protein
MLRSNFASPILKPPRRVSEYRPEWLATKLGKGQSKAEISHIAPLLRPPRQSMQFIDEDGQIKVRDGYGLILAGSDAHVMIPQDISPLPYAIVLCGNLFGTFLRT